MLDPGGLEHFPSRRKRSIDWHYYSMVYIFQATGYIGRRLVREFVAYMTSHLHILAKGSWSVTVKLTLHHPLFYNSWNGGQHEPGTGHSSPHMGADQRLDRGVCGEDCYEALDYSPLIVGRSFDGHIDGKISLPV